MVKAVVVQPEQVVVQETAGEGRVDVLFSVAADDYGRVIGRNGQTIDAIRRLAESAAQRKGLTVSVEVAEGALSGPTG